MRWQCPHCATQLAASDTEQGSAPVDTHRKDALAEWKLFACYKCGGFSMRSLSPGPGSPESSRDPNRPPPFRRHLPRILQANRSPDQPPIAETTRYSPRPPAFPRSLQKDPAPTATAGMMVVSEIPALPKDIAGASRMRPPEAPANFEILRTHLGLDAKKQEQRNTARKTQGRLDLRISTATARQAVLSFLVAASSGAGYLLYQQGLEIQKLAARSPPPAPAARSETLSDRITTSRAAPARSKQTDDSPAARIQVDESEPGMRYEYLERRLPGRAPAIGD